MVKINQPRPTPLPLQQPVVQLLQPFLCGMTGAVKIIVRGRLNACVFRALQI